MLQPSHFGDSSGPLFAMYLRIADEQDRRRAELLRSDTDQILIFVSSRIFFRPTTSRVNSKAIVWIVLCCRRSIGRCVDARSEAQRTRYRSGNHRKFNIVLTLHHGHLSKQHGRMLHP